MISMLFAAAHASQVEVWTAEDFPRNADVVGEDGWEGGWNQDPWMGYQGSNNWAVANQDEGYGNAIGSTGAASDYIVNHSAEVGQGTVTVQVYPDGNDSWGVVFGHVDADEWYVYLFCGDDGDGTKMCPVLEQEVEAPYIALVHVQDGSGEILDIDEAAFSQAVTADIEVSYNDGEIRASNQRWGQELSAAVELRGLGGIGFYCFEQGYAEGGESYGPTYFAPPTVSAYDDDDDGVIDDLDNCEKVPNEDQADRDDDGLGTACDEDEGEDTGDSGDTGDTDDSGKPDSADTATDTGGHSPKGADIELPGGCGCASTPSLGWAAAGLALLAARRRR